jgi:hypothetical protein
MRMTTWASERKGGSAGGTPVRLDGDFDGEAAFEQCGSVRGRQQSDLAFGMENEQKYGHADSHSPFASHQQVKSTVS